MPFLQRSNSKRLQENSSVRSHGNTEAKETKLAPAESRKTFESIDEAMSEHQRSMAERPRSAGVEKKKPKRSPSSKRATPVAAKQPVELLNEQLKCGKDLNRHGQTIEYSTGFDTFNFPTPSPQMPPRSATFNPRTSSHSPAMMSRSRTYRHSPRLQPYDDSPRIGRAIGSPSQLATMPTWGRTRTVDGAPMGITAGLPPAQSPPRVPTEERLENGVSVGGNKKKSGWKAFGNLFRSKTTREPFYKVKPQSTTVADATTQDAISPELDAVEREASARPPTPVSCLLAPSPGVARPSHSRDSSQSRALSRQDQHSDRGHRTSLLPRGLGLRMKGGTPLPSPQVTSPGTWRMSEDTHGNDSSLSGDGYGEDKRLPASRTPRLALHLPSLDFPRYSVMFEKQLSGGRRQSLLERRQSRLQRSQPQTQNDGDGHLHVATDGAEIRRSKTSPSFNRTLSVRISEERACVEEPRPAVQRPRQIVHSKTAPPGAMSPVAAAFMRPREGTQHSSSPESPSSAFYSENSLPPTPTTTTTCTDAGSVRQMLQQAEPAWEILNPHISPPRPSTHRSQSHSFSTGAERSFSTDDDNEPHSYHIDDPRVKSPEDLERQIVQVSVARQVSVSRARTRVMRVMEGTAKQPAVVPLRPRIIEFSKNRKSAVGVLEDAAADMEDALPENAAAHSRAASLAHEEAKRKSMASVQSGPPHEKDVPDLPGACRSGPCVC